MFIYECIKGIIHYVGNWFKNLFYIIIDSLLLELAVDDLSNRVGATEKLLSDAMKRIESLENAVDTIHTRSSLVPHQPSPVPYQPSLIPQPVPHQPLPVPYQPSSVPHQPSSVPHQPSSVPYQPSSNPRQPALPIPYPPSNPQHSLPVSQDSHQSPPIDELSMEDEEMDEPPPLPPPVIPYASTPVSRSHRWNLPPPAVVHPAFNTSPPFSYQHSSSDTCPYPLYQSNYQPSPYPPPTTPYSNPTQKTVPQCFSIQERRKKDKLASLSSFEIEKENLVPVEAVLKKYPSLRHETNAGKLAVKLAREAFFGSKVLKQCTVMGCRNFPSLPLTELNDLKQTLFNLFPSYWSNPVEFESKIWNSCVNSIGQLCKRLRND